VRRRWIDEATYADIVALCQSLPGPTSSEVGIAIGLLRAGPFGAFLAWLGFTLPSAFLMFVVAYALDRVIGTVGPVGRALELVALVVVAFAVWRMARALAWDARRGAIALAAAVLALGTHNRPITAIESPAARGKTPMPPPPRVRRAHAHLPPCSRVRVAARSRSSGTRPPKRSRRSRQSPRMTRAFVR